MVLKSMEKSFLYALMMYHLDVKLPLEVFNKVFYDVSQ